MRGNSEIPEKNLNNPQWAATFVAFNPLVPKQWDTTAVPLGSGVINFMQMNWDSAQLMIVPFSILITGHNPPYPQKCKLWGPVFQLVLWRQHLTGHGIILDCQKIVDDSMTFFLQLKITYLLHSIWIGISINFLCDENCTERWTITYTHMEVIKT